MAKLPRWARDVPDLSASLDEVGRYWSLEMAARETGLSPVQLREYLDRPQITNATKAASRMSRPARRLGKEPLYSPEQCQEYVKLAGAPSAKAALLESLETVTAAQAEELGLATMDQLADEHRITRSTLKNHMQTYGGFPPIRAKLSRAGKAGRPAELRSKDEVAAWLLATFGPREEAC